MGMSAILVIWPELFEQTFVPPIPMRLHMNLVSIDLLVSEIKMFEECGRRWTDADGRRKGDQGMSII